MIDKFQNALLDEIDRLKTINAELLKALEGIIDAAEAHVPIRDLCTKARSVIVKARRQS